MSIPTDATEFFEVNTSIIVGDGTSFSFWDDHRLDGETQTLMFPILYTRCRRKINVKEGLQHKFWITLIKPNLSAPVISKHIDL